MWVHPTRALQRREGQPDAILVLKRDARAFILHNHGEHDDRNRVIRVDGLRAGSHADFAVVGRKFHRVCEQVHENLLQTILVTDDPMLDQTAVVVRDRHSPRHVLELNQLDDFVEHVVHDEVVVLFRDLAIVEQSQV